MGPSPAVRWGLPAAAANWLVCPLDGAAPLDLVVTQACRLEDARATVPRLRRASSGYRTGVSGAGIVSGTLTCPNCARCYPIEDGIPSLLPDPQAIPRDEAAAKHDERRKRDEEAYSYDANWLLRLLSAAEIPATLRRLGLTARDTLLEVGCGTGRFTERLAGRPSTFLAIDHSRESLNVARDKVGPLVAFVQADASYLPVRSGWATRVLSCQMLEHLPTPDSRRRAVCEMARALAPNGSLVLSAYWYPPLLRAWMEKEGRHSDTIYFYRFDRSELAALLRPYVRLRSLSGRLVYVLLAHAIKPA
jgi:SAM-dependent methyltransferase